MAHRGPDGARTAVSGSVGMGCQHFWTTPEDVGCHQPTSRRGEAVSVLFDGRIDNRDELVEELGAGQGVADAELVLAAYHLWGEDLFPRLLGPFAAVIHERFKRRTLCARDAMGERTLFYRADDHLLVLASEESVLLAHPAVSSRLDEESVARHFALAAPAPGRTFYAEVSEVRAGTVVCFDAAGRRERRFWSPPETRLRYRRDEEYAEHFRDLLDRSVASRLRATQTPAVLMSGGLDSTALAALAAARVGARDRDARLPVVSWIFDELRACDERRYMDAMERAHPLRSIRLGCDDAWPLSSGAARRPRSLDAPIDNPYRELLDRAYGAIRGDGRRVLLTGWFGDLLYGGIGEWWADLVGDGRLGEALFELVRGWRNGSSRDRVLTPLRSALGRWLRRGTPPPPPRLDRHPWLSASARARLAGASEPAHRADRLLAGSHQWYAKEEERAAVRYQVDVRHPYWDRRLVEFALAVPRYVLFRPGREKLVLRQGLGGDLPPEILGRRSQSSLAELFRRGVMERERHTVESVLQRPAADWQSHVDPGWLWGHWGERRAAIDGPESVVAWSCVSWELWREGRATGRELAEVAR